MEEKEKRKNRESNETLKYTEREREEGICKSEKPDKQGLYQGGQMSLRKIRPSLFHQN
jgi:hypothetical protein